MKDMDSYPEHVEITFDEVQNLRIYGRIALTTISLTFAKSKITDGKFFE
jgi:hypothetical protein